LTLIQPKVRRWNKREYHEAADLGWFDGQRVELIDGEVIEMPPQKDAHAFAVRLALAAVGKAFSADYTLLVQMPLSLGPSSEPEPDIAVARGSLRTVKTHPKTAVLVLEVADTSLAFNVGRKASLYASRGIRDYWVVNLMDRQLEVRRRPVPDRSSDFGHSYADTTILRVGQSIAPLAARKTKIKVADLLP
jgi:Uma2 family endonuclease